MADAVSHGDLLFLSYSVKTSDPDSHPTTQAQASSSTSHPTQPDPSHPHTHTDPPLSNVASLADVSHVEEQEVDKFWQSQSGKIERKRDSTFCRHGEKGMCDYCMPLEVGLVVSLTRRLNSLVVAVRCKVPSRAAD